MEGLKPCPFCGEQSPILRPRSNGAYWEIVCQGDCGASFIDDTEKQAIAAWNRRAETKEKP